MHDAAQNGPLDGFQMQPVGVVTKLTHTIDIIPLVFLVKLFVGAIPKQEPKRTVAAMESLQQLLAA